MNFTELVAFIRENGPTILGVVVIVGPVLAAIYGYLYKNRIEEADAAKRRLEAESEALRKKIEAAAKAAAGSVATGAPPGAAHETADTGILAAWPRTNDASEANLVDLIKNAKKRITVFGLTRNFYVTDEIRAIILAKSQEIPVVFFLMAPGCDSRKDRYRLEPIEAALEDPGRYEREVEKPFAEMLRAYPRTEAGSNVPGLAVYYFNFPCSFAIEEIDDRVRVMLYGHGKRGTEGPILLLDAAGKLGCYFQSQIRWLERLATQGAHPPWSDKGIAVTPMQT